jgi:hypothetical protein
MTKIVYNNCYGGFGLSEKAVMRYAELKGIKLYKGKGNSLYTPFYTVPEEEYNKIHSEDLLKKDYRRSNELYFTDRGIERDDPILVQVVEELGEEASSHYASLAIAEIPSGTLYRIDEYDGSESVMTAEDYDWKVAR